MSTETQKFNFNLESPNKATRYNHACLQCAHRKRIQSHEPACRISPIGRPNIYHKLQWSKKCNKKT